MAGLDQDKDFQGLSKSDQFAYLHDTDPDFKTLSPSDQQAYINHITKAPNAPESTPETTQFERERPPAEKAPAWERMASGAWSAAKGMNPFQGGELPKTVGGAALESTAKTLPAVGMVESGIKNYEQARKENQGIIPSAASAIGGAIGLNPESIRQRASQGDVAGVIGEGIPAAGAVALEGGVRRLPSATRAGQALQEIRGAANAGNVPIDVSAPGNAALDIQSLAEKGGTLPKVIRDFIRRTTDPNKPPITFGEARDFYSNATRLSADEMQRLTPPMKRAIGDFTSKLNASLEGAAGKVGQLENYQGAMKEYARAKGLEGAWDKAVKALPYVGAGVGAYDWFNKFRKK